MLKIIAAALQAHCDPTDHAARVPPPLLTPPRPFKIVCSRPGYNPATWMLEVTGGSMSTTFKSSGQDFPALYQVRPRPNRCEPRDVRGGALQAAEPCSMACPMLASAVVLPFLYALLHSGRALPCPRGLLPSHPRHPLAWRTAGGRAAAAQ